MIEVPFWYRFNTVRKPKPKSRKGEERIQERRNEDLNSQPFGRRDQFDPKYLIRK
jgi:hypothetical protein